MQELRAGYFVSNACKICQAKDREGNPLRDLIDHRRSQGVSQTQLVKELAAEGVLTGQPNIAQHFKKHSPWLLEKQRQLQMAKTQNEIESQRVMHRSAEDELQKLVDLGGDRIDAGEMVVDKEMYLFALNKKTTNNTPISIQNLVMQFGDSLIEKYQKPSQIIEGQVREKEIE